jgi:hypothetical protein
MMGGRLLVFSLFLLVQCMSLTTTATVVVEPRPTVDVDGYAEWTQGGARDAQASRAGAHASSGEFRGC